MLSLHLLSAALLAGLAAATPIADTSLATIEKRSPPPCVGNATEFCNDGLGCQCFHVPSDCTAYYTVQPDDSCDGIGAKFDNFTLSILYYWNPDIGLGCGLAAYQPLCINTPWYHFAPPVQPAPGSIEGNDVPTNQPIPTAPLTTPKCTKFEIAGAGYGVEQMEAQNGISDEQFYAWNPYVNQSAPVTWAGYWYCVGASS